MATQPLAGSFPDETSIRSRFAGAVGRQRAALSTLLAIPGFLQLCAGNGLAHAGLRFQSLVVAWVVLDTTESKLWLGIVNGVPALVALLFSPIGGVLADSRRPSRVLLHTRSALAIASFVAAGLVVTGSTQPAWLFLVVVCSVATTAIDVPVARNVIYMAAGPEQVQRGSALNSIILNLVNIAGPAVFALVMELWGPATAFGLLGAGYIAARLLAARSTAVVAGDANDKREGAFAALKAGLGYLRANPEMGRLVSLAFLVPIAGVFFAMLPVYARGSLDIGASGLGLLLVVYGAGNLCGSTFVLAKGKLRRRGAIVAITGVVYGAGIVVFAVSSAVVVSFAVAFVMGAMAMVWQNTLSTLTQDLAAPAMRGRTMGVYTMGIQMVSLGWLIGGLTAAAVGPETTLLSAGAAFIGLSIFVLARDRQLLSKH